MIAANPIQPVQHIHALHNPYGEKVRVEIVEKEIIKEVKVEVIKEVAKEVIKYIEVRELPRAIHPLGRPRRAPDAQSPTRPLPSRRDRLRCLSR